jgi:hypothetical protein
LRIAATQAAFLFFASQAPLSLPHGADKQAARTEVLVHEVNRYFFVKTL